MKNPELKTKIGNRKSVVAKKILPSQGGYDVTRCQTQSETGNIFTLVERVSR